MVDSRTTYARDVVALLRDAYGKKLKLYESIPRSVRVEEPSVKGRSIYLHEPKGKTAGAYRRLLEGAFRMTGRRQRGMNSSAEKISMASLDEQLGLGH